eukprot:TRINITY_DN9085_c0_g1_i1.p1 TRINITY_DN9085_c0_g1~~TRINITY_DN9085_c0_g1_i1.p1  ORF type:complete len:215 (+),score=46.65 TRINITY_DN9085_c0_g1_i1:168-812(+)
MPGGPPPCCWCCLGCLGGGSLLSLFFVRSRGERTQDSVPHVPLASASAAATDAPPPAVAAAPEEDFDELEHPQMRKKKQQQREEPALSRALYDAAWNCDFHAAFDALEEGADPSKGYGGRKITAMHVASRIGDPAILAMLLKRGGAPLEVKNRYGETPLFSAVIEGNALSTELLVEAKADVNARDDEGKTPLMIVKERGKQGFVDYLVANGAVE